MSAEAPVLLALDCGTSSIKAGLFDPQAAALGVRLIAKEPMQVERPAADRAEMRISAILAAVERCLRAAAAAVKRPLQIGICAHVSSFLPVGSEDGQARADRFEIWCDRRCAPMLPKLPSQDWALETLGSALPWACNWLLVKARHGRALADDEQLLQVGDMVFRWLCGCSQSHASSQVSLVDQRTGAYAPAALEQAGLHRGQLPIISQECVPLLAERRQQLGLAQGSCCAPALADMHASFLGPGLRDGEGLWLANTSEILGLYEQTERRQAPRRLLRCALDQGFMHYGSTSAGGANLNWCCETMLGRPLSALDQLEQEAAEVPAACEGLLHLPFLDGERAPLWDAQLRGGFQGLQAHHGPAAMLRAVIEGVAFGKRLLAEYFEAALPGHFVIGGGGAHGLLNRVRAAVMARPLKVCEQTELGIFGLLRHLLRLTNQDEALLDQAMTWHWVEADPDWIGIYDEAYAAFKTCLPEEHQACPVQ